MKQKFNEIQKNRRAFMTTLPEYTLHRISCSRNNWYWICVNESRCHERNMLVNDFVINDVYASC